VATSISGFDRAMRSPGRADVPDEPNVLELRSRVPGKSAGQPLGDYLAGRFRYHDRDAWAAHVTAGRVLVDGRSAHADDPVRAGAEVLYRKVHREPWVDDRIRVLHTDPDLVVVDKPAHLPMHADGPFVRHTLIHLLRTAHDFPDARVVHRLDRETSGVVVLPRTRRASRAVQEQFRAGTVEKLYLTVVAGRVEEHFHCDRPIGHSATSRIALRRSAAPDAVEPRPAFTRFAVVEHGPAATLLRCQPTTGRTHQIRVHLENCGHPVLGDKLYGRPDDDYLAFVHRMKAGGDPRAGPDDAPDRQLLHACSLEFDHPATGERVRYEAGAPPSFRDWLRRADRPS